MPQPLDRARGRRNGGPTTEWSADTFRKRICGDLKKLGLRRRSPHDGRSTFISLTVAAGCNSEIMSRVTHPCPVETVRDGYNRQPWQAVCAEMMKYSIKGPKAGSVPEVPNLTDSGTDTDQVAVTAEKRLEPAGVEIGGKRDPKDTEGSVGVPRVRKVWSIRFPGLASRVGKSRERTEGVKTVKRLLARALEALEAGDSVSVRKALRAGWPPESLSRRTIPGPTPPGRSSGSVPRRRPPGSVGTRPWRL